MPELDQLSVGQKVLEWKRTMLDLEHANAQYWESLFLTRRNMLARQNAQKSCFLANQELRCIGAEMAKKYKSLCNIERAPSSRCCLLPHI